MEPVKGRHAKHETPKDTHPEDRVCGEEGCITKLSKYNGDDRCYIHRLPKPMRLSARMPRRPQL